MSSPENLAEASLSSRLADRSRRMLAAARGRRGRVPAWRRAVDYVPAAALLILVIVAWQAYVRLFDVSDIILPAPTEVASTLVDRWPSLEPEMMVTLSEAAQGFLLAAVVGLALAIAITSSRMLRLALYPLLVTSQAMPVIAIAPLLVTWFGYGPTSKILVSALVAFFPMVVSSAAGLASLDSGVVSLMRSFPAGRLQIFLRARLPNALPQIFAGLKVAAVLSVIGAVVGEWVGSDEGLGYLIVRANATLAIDLVFAAIVLLSLMGIAFFVAVSLVERVVTPWRRQELTPMTSRFQTTKPKVG
jgi:NitT/TauT family transport system permease protein